MTVYLPEKISIGGTDLRIEYPEKINNNLLGQVCVAEGVIRIAQKYNCAVGDIEQSNSSKANTFYHELTHAILTTMGEHELNENEKFVCVFSSFLASSMQQIIEIEFDKDGR